MNLFIEFHAGRLPIHSLNFRIITLLPKITDVQKKDSLGALQQIVAEKIMLVG